MVALLAKIIVCAMSAFSAPTAPGAALYPLNTVMLAGIGSESFAYDRLGNRRGDTAGYTDRQGRVSTYQHNQVNEYTGITVAGQAGTPVHDLAGNLTGNGSGYGFTYDYENRLVRVFTDTNGNGIQDAGETVLADYTYDALGRRIRQVKDGQTRPLTLRQAQRQLGC